MVERWQEMRRRVASIGRPLTCPLCHHKFAYRHHFRAARACPNCKVPLGFPFYYRLILLLSHLCAAGYVMYRGYEAYGQGWFLLGLPFAAIAGFYLQIVILRTFPPKLEAYAEGNTWLKLS